MNRTVTRLAQALFTIYFVATLTFGMIRLLPGGPMTYLQMKLSQQNQNVDPQRVAALVESYSNVNPQRPILEQYVNYITAVAQGDLGRSIWFQEPVSDLMASALPWTVFVMGVSISLAYLIAIVSGSLMAYLEGSRFDSALTAVFALLNSIPFYVVAVLFLFWFGFQTQTFPTGTRLGEGIEPGLTVEFIQSAFYHATLPILSVVLTAFAGPGLKMRANSISVIGEDYIRVAKLRGLPMRRISTRYVARNAILPMYTTLMISIGFMFGGSIILEEIFRYRGMGWYMFTAIQSRDFPLIMGSFLLITTMVVLGILFADLTYGKLDPRAGEQRNQSYGRGFSLVDVLKKFHPRRIMGWFHSKGEDRRGRTVRETNGGAGPMGGNTAGTSDESHLDTNGGRIYQGGESSLTVTAEDDVTTRENIYRLLDLWVLAPLRILWDDLRARVGMFIVIGYVLVGTVGVWALDTTSVNEGPKLLPPFQDMAFPLGTDGLGQSLLTLTVHATPAMLELIMSGAVFAIAVATVIGTLSGYIGGTLDKVLMVFTDTMMTIPGLPLVIVLASIFEPEATWQVGILLTVNAWAGLARALRSEVLTLREREYVEASRAMDLSTWRILQKDLLPNMMPYVMMNFVSTARGVIFSSVGLYFLGILPFTNLNWGVMLNTAYNRGGLYIPEVLHWFVVPMVTIIVLSYGLILISQGLDRVFNPRIRAKHAETVEGDESQVAA